MSIFMLFFQFMKFGALAFGGGFTIFPLLFDTFVTESGLFTDEQFGNLISIAQMTPGPVTINIATFVGYLEAGPLASVIASLGLIAPSLIVTGTALFFMKKYQDSWFIEGFLKGAHLVAFVMVLYAIVLFANMSILSAPWQIGDIWQSLIQGRFIGPENYHINWLELGIALGAFALIRRKIPVTRILFGAAFIGYAVSFL